MEKTIFAPSDYNDAIAKLMAQNDEDIFIYNEACAHMDKKCCRYEVTSLMSNFTSNYTPWKDFYDSLNFTMEKPVSLTASNTISQRKTY